MFIWKRKRTGATARPNLAGEEDRGNARKLDAVLAAKLEPLCKRPAPMQGRTQAEDCAASETATINARRVAFISRGAEGKPLDVLTEDESLNR